MQQTAVIIVAGGSGARMGSSQPKQFLFLDSLPLLGHTINRFAEALPGAEIVVVLPATHIDYWRNLAARFDIKPHTLTEGGAERFDSVRNGLATVKSTPELIVVQDGVRPLATAELIHRVAEAAATHGAAIPVVEPVDSFRQIKEEGAAPRSQIIDRHRLRIVQTPQVFRAELLRDAYLSPYCQSFTDDASVVEAAGHPITLCEGERTNLKITTRDDLTLAEAILAARREIAEERESEETNPQ